MSKYYDEKKKKETKEITEEVVVENIDDTKEEITNGKSVKVLRPLYVRVQPTKESRNLVDDKTKKVVLAKDSVQKLRDEKDGWGQIESGGWIDLSFTEIV